MQNMLWTVNLEGGPRRVNHAATSVGHYIYSFGGYCTGDDYRYMEVIDVYMLNIHTLRWTEIPPQMGPDDKPLKYPDVPFQRYGHTVATYKDKIYMWGGRNDDSLCSRLFCFDPATRSWSTPKVSGRRPEPRDGHSACVVGNNMYIFGGFVDQLSEFSCDVHCLNFDTMTWRFVHTYGVPPSFRDFHTAVEIFDRMYIFGGRGDKFSPYNSHEEKYCSEIVYLDLKTLVWHSPPTTGHVPVGRRSHSMVIYNGLIYVFGGYNGLMEKHFNDLYIFDPKTNCWMVGKPLGEPPCIRRRHACVVKDSRMILFGGTSPNFEYSNEHQSLLIENNDLFVLDFKPSLKTLAMLVVIKNDIDTSGLPKELRSEIRTMTEPNTISINYAGYN